MQILNVKNLNTGNMDDVIAFCQEASRNGNGAFLIPMNPIKVIKARRHSDFQNIIDNASWVFPDAWGMKWAARFLYRQNVALLPGYRVMLSMIEQAAYSEQSVYFLGTTDDVLAIASERLNKRYLKLRIIGMHHGFFSDSEEERVFEDIARLNPDYVFVAMGEYKQEKVISRLRPRCPTAIYMGVGGSLDLIAGKQPTPPEWIRRNHLEWLFRLFRQPFRAPRFKALPIFVSVVCLEKLRCVARG